MPAVLLHAKDTKDNKRAWNNKKTTIIEITSRRSDTGLKGRAEKKNKIKKKVKSHTNSITISYGTSYSPSRWRDAADSGATWILCWEISGSVVGLCRSRSRSGGSHWLSQSQRTHSKSALDLATAATPYLVGLSVWLDRVFRLQYW